MYIDVVESKYYVFFSLQSNEGYPDFTEPNSLFSALVDLAEERLEHLLLQTLGLIHSSDLLT